MHSSMVMDVVPVLFKLIVSMSSIPTSFFFFLFQVIIIIAVSITVPVFCESSAIGHYNLCRYNVVNEHALHITQSLLEGFAKRNYVIILLDHMRCNINIKWSLLKFSPSMSDSGTLDFPIHHGLMCLICSLA
ncbi:hypothetical protein P5673_011677, partial [Acropora cervicornis]